MKRRRLGEPPQLSSRGTIRGRPHTLRDTMTEHIIVDDEESTRTITMRRPEKKNTLTQEMYLAMSDAIDSAQSDSAIRCLILTGRAGVFTAGNDIADFLQAATAKDHVVRPRNAVIFLQSLVSNR